MYDQKNDIMFALIFCRMKDEAAGEVPVAFVVRSNGSKISEDEIKQYISKQVNFQESMTSIVPSISQSFVCQIALVSYYIHQNR